MRKILIILLLTLAWLPLSLQAGQTGILKGKVVNEEGKPVVGATVRVLGTARGTVIRNSDGTFAIVNIDAGIYTIKVTFVGLPDTEKKNVKISADETTDITVNMTSGSKEVITETLTVYGNRDMVNNNTIGRVQKMDAEEIKNIAREGISGIVGMNAGVVSLDGGYQIRGSRTEETTVKIDGINKSNIATGTTIRSGPSEFDTEEIQVHTGGMGAEYGGAMGGMVNTVMKRGRTDRYEGYLRYRSDLPIAWGYQKSGKKLVYDDVRQAYKAVPSGDGAQFQGPGQTRLQYGTGGPLPYLTNSTFYVSTNYTYRKYNSPSYEIYDPWDNNLGLMPDQQNWNKNLSARLRFAVISGIELNLGFEYGSVNAENSSTSWLYSNDEGWLYDINTNLPKLDKNGNPLTNGIPERVAKQQVSNELNSTAFVRINHTLTPSSYYQITISNSIITEEYSKRKGWEDPNYFTGFDVWYPQDDYTASGAYLIPNKVSKIINHSIDQYEIIKKTAPTVDGYMYSDFSQRNPLTGYIEGAGDATGTDNPWGRANAFYTHGNNGGFEFRKSNAWSVDGIYENVISGEISHNFKSGFDFFYYTLTRHYNSIPQDGTNSFFDVYSDEWGGNLYAESSSGREKTSKAFKPMSGSAFVMDQMNYKGIIITPSLRFDLFIPNSNYRSLDEERFISINADSGFSTSSLKYQLSPRINVTYPITDRSNVTLSYGLYFQMPVLSAMYDAFATDRLRGNQILGDPNMEAQRTNQYEINYNNQLTDIFSFTLAGYYKDVYNQLGMIYVPAVPTPYFQYAVSEYGNSKGLEFTLHKRPTPQDHFGMRLNYALAQSVATSSSPGDNYNRPVDPYSELIAFPLSEFPTAGDVRHRVYSYFDFQWFNDQGPAIGGIYLIENTSLNFTTTWRSGFPYTKTDYTGIALGEIRTERAPAVWSTDMSLSRDFPLKDWFGDQMRNSSLKLTLFVYNIFNLNDAVGLYTSTNDADDIGQNFRRKKGDFSDRDLYEKADFTNVNSFASTQYDNYGKRLYSKEADLDGNGLVNQEEKFRSFIKQIENTTVQFQGNYQTPRQVFFDISFTF